VRAKSELGAKSRRTFLFPNVHLKIASFLLICKSAFIVIV